MRDRHFIVHHSHDRYDIREIATEVAASVTSYGVVTMDHYCREDECWHFYFINARFVEKNAREEALATLVEMVPSISGG